MARKKVIESAITLENWNEADDALRAIGEHTRDIRAIENVMNEQIAAAKSAADVKAKPLMEQVAMLETALRVFATEHRADMGKLKSYALTFGTVSFRRSTKVKLPTARAKLDAIIARIREAGMLECIKQSAPTVDKDALKKYPEKDIISVGASLIVDEVFGYEVDEEKIR